MSRRHPTDQRRHDPGEPPQNAIDRYRKAGCGEIRICRYLLTQCIRRLRAGRAVEESHGVVHPEVSSIVRDVERRARRLNQLVGTPAQDDQDDLQSLVEDL